MRQFGSRQFGSRQFGSRQFHGPAVAVEPAQPSWSTGGFMAGVGPKRKRPRSRELDDADVLFVLRIAK